MPPGYPPPGYQLPPGYYQPVPPPLPVSPAGVPLADFGIRLLAYIIDAVLLSAVSLIFVIPAAFVVFRRSFDAAATYDYTTPTPFPDFILPLLLLELCYFVLVLVLRYLYEVELMHRYGQTVGKRIMKIRVVPLDPSVRLTRGMAFKRYLVQFVATIFVPFLSLIDGLWQLWDKPYLQTLHDKAAATVVVKVSA
ncbi:RDD family protein [Actinoplanes sp. KI2]|uniref:RDD family protein n=1 Tax=Actinoplanes sp. KI2 TaxID=2983315 RepID=UPI0021D5F786|nr:RDD family protein [Actinoplanes sp. KI2]MCU7727231.1 RDD family protein [Actinoplanes sp. KI2]